MFVSTDRFAIGRRSFLAAAAPLVLGWRSIVEWQTPVERGRFSNDDIPLVRERLLELVNAERKRLDLSRLELHELACKVADEHAGDMVEGQFLSHWGSDGRKPYQRYSFAGGNDAIQENVSLAQNIASVTATSVTRDFVDMHESMINEVPPNDGHRRAILYPHHTHVGFGVAIKHRALRLDELYVSRYAQVDAIPRQARVKAKLTLRGNLLNPKHEVTGVYVYYEPLPVPPPVEWLRIPRSYAMPDVYERLLPKLSGAYYYPNGSKGTIEQNNRGKFQTPVTLFRDPGINTIVLWIRRAKNEAPFPATQICIRCE